MPDILSQDQIDELINEFKDNKTDKEPVVKKPERRIRTYDFRIPKRFNKEQLKTLSIIYENYGRNLSSYLSGVLRTFCQVEVMAIEEQRYFEFSNAISENTMIGIMQMDPLEGTSMIAISQELSFGIIDRLLGGQGETVEINREFTEIEIVLMQSVIREMCRLLKDAWSNVYEITPSLLNVQGNSKQVQFVSPNETVVIIALDVEIKDTKGTTNFCIPYQILEPVLENLNTRYWFTNNKAPEENKKAYRRTIFNKLSTINMELDAVLGTSRITLKETADLHAGDVILLDQRIGQKAVLKSNGNDWFKGTLGLYKNHVAMRIDEILTDGAINDESK